MHSVGIQLAPPYVDAIEKNCDTKYIVVTQWLTQLQLSSSIVVDESAPYWYSTSWPAVSATMVR